MSSSKLLTISQAASFIGVSAKTLRRWEDRGTITPIRNVLGQRRYSTSDLIKLKDQKGKPLPIKSNSDNSTVRHLDNSSKYTIYDPQSTIHDSSNSTIEQSNNHPQSPIYDPGSKIENLLPISTAASLLGISIKTLRRWSDTKIIATHRNTKGEREFSPIDIDLLAKRRKSGEIITPPQVETLKNEAVHYNLKPETYASPSSRSISLPGAPPPPIVIGKSSQGITPHKNRGVISFLTVLASFLLLFGAYGNLKQTSTNYISFVTQNITNSLNNGNTKTGNGLIGKILGITTSVGSAISFEDVIDQNFNLGLTGYLEARELKSTTTSGAPITVNSQQLVTNLNADLLDGKHYADIEALIESSGNLQAAYNSGSSITTNSSDLSLTFSDQITDANFLVKLKGDTSKLIVTGNADETILTIDPNAPRPFAINQPTSINGNTTINGSLTIQSTIAATGTLNLDDANTTSSIPFSDTTYTGLPSGKNSILHALNSAQSLFTDNGTITYLTQATDDLAIGGTGLDSSFSVDVSDNKVRIGKGSGTNAQLEMFASDGAAGILAYTTSDAFNFQAGNVIIDQTLQVSGGNITGANSEVLGIGTTDDLITLTGNGGSDNTDLYINLDGAYPTLFSNTDSAIGINDNLTFVGARTISNTSGNLTITPAGSLVISTLNCTANTNGGALTADASGVISCSDDESGSAGVNYWRLSDGALSPYNDTLDFLVGSSASSSAKFAVLNVNSGTPTASISAGTTGATYLTADGSLSTTAKQNLNFGGTTTGNVNILNSAGSAFTTFDTANGRVGIGTTTPDQGLHLVDTGAIVAHFTSSNNTDAYLQFENSAASKVTIGIDGGRLKLGASSDTTVDHLSISTTGNVDVGNVTNTHRFKVEGSYAGNSLVSLNETGSNDIFTASASGTTRFVIQNNGDVGIGIAAPEQILQIGNKDTNGTFFVSNTSTIIAPTGAGPGGGLLKATRYGRSGYELRLGETIGNDAVVGGNAAGAFFGAMQNNRQVNIDNMASSPNAPILLGGNPGGGTPTSGYYIGLIRATMIGSSSAPDAKLQVTGAQTGKALVILNETGNQDILTASVSGVTRFTVANDGELKLYDSDATAYVGLKSPAVLGSSTTYTLPGADGSNGYVMTTNGSGTLTWSDVASLTSDMWNRNSNVLSSSEYWSDSLALGGTSSASAGIVLNSNGSAVFNEQGNDADFRVEGDTNANLLFVDASTDRVGIGTNNPLSTLHVNGGVGSLATGLSFGDGDTGIYEASDDNLYFSSAGSTRLGLLGPSNFFVAEPANTNAPGFYLGTSTVTVPSLLPRWGDSDTGIGGTTGNTLSLITGGSSRVFLDSNGNVGIGTTSPTSKLHTTGSYAGNALVTLNETSATNDIFTASSSGTTRFVIQNDGDVAIGSNNPSAHLNVYNTDAANYLNIVRNADYNYFRVYMDGSETAVKLSGGGGKPVRFGTYSIDDLRIMVNSQETARFTQNRELVLFDSDSTNYTGFVAPAALGSDIVYTLPSADGSNGYVMTTNGSGTLSWQDVAALTSDLWNRNSNVLSSSEYWSDSLALGGTSSASAGIVLNSNGSAVFNEQGNDADLRVEGDTEANLLFVDASTNRVGIGTNSPSARLEIQGVGAGSTGLLIKGGPSQSGDFMQITDSTGALEYFSIDPTNGAIFNEIGASSADFRVEGDTNANLLFVDSSADKVGIGTNTPSDRLHVYNNVDSTSQVLIENANAGTNADVRVELKNDANIRGGFFLGSSNRSNYSNDVLFYSNNNQTFMTNNTVASGGSGYMSFMTGGYNSNQERLRITSTGNVGIGTTSPASKLHVSGSYAGNALVTLNETGSNDIFTASSSGTNRLVIKNDGKVGIGTSTPGQELDIKNGDIRIDMDSGVGGNLYLYKNGANIARFGADAPNSIVQLSTYDTSDLFFNVPTNRYTAFNVNNVEIGRINVNGLTLNSQADVRLGDSDSSHYTGFQAPATITSNIVYTLPSADGSSGYVLTTDGSGTMSWTNSGSLSSSYWSEANGALFPTNNTTDLLIGGSATTSAKFAFTGVNSGTPTASISGNLSLRVPTGSAPAATLNILNGGTLDVKSASAGQGDAGLNTLATFGPNNVTLYGKRTSGGSFAKALSTQSGTSGALVHVNQDNIGASDTYNIFAVDGGSIDYLFNVYGNARDKVVIGGGDTTLNIRAHILTAATSYVGLAVEGFAGQTAALQEWQNSSGTPLSWVDESGNFRIGGSAADAGLLNVTGAYTGKALAILNETGDQDIFTASASGSTQFVISNNGTLLLGGSNSSTAEHIIPPNGDVIFNSPGNNIDFRVEGVSNANTLFVDASANSVGIGTNTPSYPLDVTGFVRSQSTSTAATGFLIDNTASPVWGVQTDTSGRFEIYDYNATGLAAVRFLIDDANGNIGVNTQTPASKLHISSSYAGNALVAFNETSSTNDIFTASASGVTKLSLSNSGQLRLFDTDASNYTGFVAPAALGSDIVYTLPSADGSNGYVMTTNGSGTLSWQDVAALTSDLWNRNSNVLSSSEYWSDSLALGGTSSASAGIVLNSNGSAVFNEQGNDADFRVEGDTNSNLLFVDASTDRVGVGTNTPGASLDVNGDIWSYSGANRITSTGFTRIGAANHYLAASGSNLELGGAGSGGLAFEVNGGVTRSMTIDTLGNIGAGTAVPASKLHVSGGYAGNALVTLNDTNGNDIFTASGSGTTRFVIQNDGDVGIGTNSPAAKLDVFGNSRFRNDDDTTNSYFMFNGIASDGRQEFTHTTTDGNVRVFAARGNYANGCVTFGKGNVGGGGCGGLDGNIVIQSSQLGLSGLTVGGNINSGTHKSLAIGTQDSQPSTGFGTTDIVDLGTFSAAGSTWSGTRPSIRYTGLTHQFRVDSTTGSTNPGTEVMRIDTTGNVGIGTTSPASKLHVSGSYAGNALVTLNETSATNDIFTASASGTTRFVIQNDGDVGIGTNNPGSKLDIVNNANDDALTITANATQTNPILRIFESDGTTENVRFYPGVADGVNSVAYILDTVNTLSTTGSRLFTLRNNGTEKASFTHAGDLALNSQADVRLYDSDSTNYTGFQAPAALGSDIVYTLPSADGSNGYVMTTNGSGTLSWQDVAALTSDLWNRNSNVLSSSEYWSDSLALGGTSSASAGIVLNSNGSAVFNEQSNDADFRIESNGNSNMFFVDASTDSVGIGTDTPYGDSDLSIYEATSPRISFANTARPFGTFNFIELTSDGKQLMYNAGFNKQSTYGHVFVTDTSNTEIMRMEADGNVSINDSTPNHKLSVTGGYAGNALVALNDTNGNDIFTASGSGTTRFVIDNSGNVGIGTNLPTSNLYILDNSVADAYIKSTASTASLTLDSAGSVGNSLIFKENGITMGSINYNGASDDSLFIDHGNAELTLQRVSGLFGFGTTSPNAKLDIYSAYAGATALNVDQRNSVGDIFSASASGTTRFVIQNDGDVGIGTSTPDEKLTVYGDGSNIKVRAATFAGSAGFMLGDTASRMQIYKPSNSSDLRINSLNSGVGDIATFDYDAGNVGIGTTSPVSKLHISSSYAGNSLVVLNETSATNDIFTASSSGTTRFVIQNDGDVGIGTNNPATALQVNGVGRFAGLSAIYSASPVTDGHFYSTLAYTNRLAGYSNGGSIYLNANDITVDAATGDSIIFSNNSTELARFLSSGNFGLGATSPASKLHVSGGYAGNALMTINDVNGNDIFTASSSGTTRLTLTNAGSLNFNQSSTIQTTTGNLTLAAAGNIVLSGFNCSGNTNGGALTTDASGIISCSDDDAGSAGANFWQLNDGALSPISLTTDINLGATATNSAKISLAGSLTRGLATVIINQTEDQDIITASSSGVTRLTLSNVGNLGVGTTLPTSKLHIEGGFGGNALAIFNNTNGTDIITASSSGTTRFRVDDSGYTHSQRFADLSNSNYFIDPAATDISMAIFAKAGIGTSLPSHQLQVVSGLNTNKALVAFNETNGNDIFTASSSGLTKLVLDNYGKLGLGTNTPDHIIEVSSSYAGNALVSLNETGTNDIFTASVSGITKAVLTNEGYLGIGAGNNPVGPLDVSVQYNYQQEITITNAGGTLTNYETLHTVDTSTLIAAGKLQSDCGDLRFTGSDRSTQLNYWIEAGCNTTTTRIWVKVPSLSNGSNTIYLHYGNSDAPNGSMVWTNSGNFIAPFEGSCPTGWSSVTALNTSNAYPRGATSYGATGGASTHTHTVTGSSGGPSGGSTVCSSGSTLAATSDHTHSFSVTSSAVSNHPNYVDVVYCSYDAGLPNDVDSTDYLGFFEATPSGWTKDNSYNINYPRGNASAGGTSSGRNRHTFTGNSASNSGSTSVCQGNASGPGTHNHSLNGPYNTTYYENLPPYLDMIFANPNTSSTALAENLVGILTTATMPPMGWTRFSALDNRLPRGHDVYGGTGGTSTHSHTGSNFTTAAQSGTQTDAGGFSGTVTVLGHTHTMSSVAAGSQTDTPPYVETVYAKRGEDTTTNSAGSESSTPVSIKKLVVEANTGNVGIGTAAPIATLHVKDNQYATASAFFENIADSGTNNVIGLAIKLGADSDNPDSGDRFVNFMRGDGTIVGKIQGNGTGGVSYTTSGVDFAEYFKKNDISEFLTPGDLICHGDAGITKCGDGHGSILGIISDQAGFVGGGDKEGNPEYALVGIVGQLGGKVASTSGSIRVGDPLTYSGDELGTLIKAVSPGIIVGHALSSYSPEEPGSGKVSVSIKVFYFDPNESLMTLEGYSVGRSELLASVPGTTPTSTAKKYTVFDQLGDAVRRVGTFSDILVANLTAGIISADQLDAKNISVGIITPVASGSGDLVIDLRNPGSTIQDLGSDNDSQFGTLIVKGNASVSGELVADSVSTNEITANTGYFDEIVVSTISAKTIAGLDEELDAKLGSRLKKLEEQLASGTTTNNSTIEQLDNDAFNLGDATVSDDTAYADSSDSDEPDLTLPSSDLDLGSTINDLGSNYYASASADLSTLAFAETDGLFVKDFLAVGGLASIVKAEITDYLTIGGTLLADGNSLSTTCPESTIQDPGSSCSNTLFLQPLGGSLNLLAGLMTLDDSGIVQIQGDLVIAGKLNAGSIATNAIRFGNLASANATGSAFTPIIAATNDNNLEVTLATNSAFVVRSALDNPVAQITASGSATFNSLTLKDNSGTATILAGEKTTIITSSAVSNKQLDISDRTQIIVTFEGDYAPATRYWVTKQTCDLPSTIHNLQSTCVPSFTIHLDYPVTTSLKTYWAIIN